MIDQDVIDAFTLWLSGAGEMKNKGEMWWHNRSRDRMTIAFPNNDTSLVVYRQYYPNGRKKIETKHCPAKASEPGKLTGTRSEWLPDGRTIENELEYEDGWPKDEIEKARKIKESLAQNDIGISSSYK